MECKAAAKNSLLGKKNITCFLTLLILTFGTAGHIQAQMFSVGDEGPRFNTPLSEVYTGYEMLSSTYEGGSVERLGEGVFAYEGPVLRLGYNSRGFDFFMGAGGVITGVNDNAYFDIGGNIDFGIPLYRSEKLTVNLPFRIASRYTNITHDERIPGIHRFQFGSLTVGAGANIMARLLQNVRIEAGAIPNYGFAFSSGGFFGGSLGVIAAQGRLYFDRLFEDVGLSLGYRYDLRNYDIDEDIYDYKIKGHSIKLGITF